MKRKRFPTKAALPSELDPIREMEDWIASLGRIDDPDSQIDLLGIRQRLHELNDPRVNPERWGRLFAECRLLRLNISKW